MIVTLFNKLKKELVQSQNLMAYTFFSFVAQIAASVIPLVIAGVLSKDIYTSFGLARSIYFFAVALTVVSVQAPFVVYANRERIETGKINKSFSTQCIFFAFSLLWFPLLSLLFANQIAAFAGISKGEWCFALLAYAGFSLRTFFGHIFLALGKRKTAGVASLLYHFSNLGFIVIFYKTGHLNLSNIFLMYFLSAMLVFIIFIWTLDFKQFVPFDFDSEHTKKMLKFASWILLGTTSAYFINWGDSFVIRVFMPFEQIAVYLFSYQIFKGFSFLLSSLNSYFLPFISEYAEDKEKLRNYLFVKRPKIIAAGIVVLACFYFIFPYPIRLIYADKFIESEPIIRILLIGIAISLYSVFYAPFFDALKLYKFNNISAFIQVAAKLALGFLLVPSLGILGAAIATVIALLLRAVLMEIYFWLKVRRLLD